MGVDMNLNCIVFSGENGKYVNYDMNNLMNTHSQGLLDDVNKFPNSRLEYLYEQYTLNHPDDERVYNVFSTSFINRSMWRQARSALYCKLYFIEKESDEYREAQKLVNTVEEKLVAEIISLPSSMVEKLFLREQSYNFKTWKSKMHYTHSLAPHKYGTLNQNNSLVSISSTNIDAGVLLFRTTPVAVAPWSIKATALTESSLSNRDVYCCFHCLSLVNKPFNEAQEDKHLVACSKHPRECNYFFCSKDCFLKNGAVHSMECEHLVKLKKFSEYYLSQSIILLVSRVLIKCRLNMEDTCRVCELDEEPNVNSELLDTLLNFYVDYPFLGLHHPRVLEEIDRFAMFLLDTLGFDFCLHLTSRELAHITTVIWVTSMPFTSYLNHSCDTEDVIGGTLFTFKLLQFKQSHTPNCVAHFDEGKLTVRSIYEIAPGTELTINTFIDKYLPPFVQAKKFWSVSSLFSSELSGPDYSAVDSTFRDLTSIRCKRCINSFCYTKAYADSDNLGQSPQNNNNTGSNSKINGTNNVMANNGNSGEGHGGKRTSSSQSRRNRYLNYKWQCDNCSSADSSELDLLENKAEDIFLRAQSLYLEGEFLQAKNRLLEFVNKWSGVLHPGHYLMYNSYLLLSGILMNKPGGNIHDSVAYFRKALIQADQVLPLVCHDRAYLYDRFADYILSVKECTRLKSSEYNDLKHLIMSSLYNCLWNWTLISGTDSYQSKVAMQKCRAVAFSLNIHAFPLSKEFIINIPNKYSVFFKAATGTKVIPNSFSSMMDSEFMGYDKPEELSDLYSVDDVASMAFCAAQSGEYDEIVLNILTTIQSYGIHHLGTGLSILGIIASNFNLEFFTAMIKATYDRITHHLDHMVLSNERSERIAKSEKYVVNLIYSILGANDLGIDPLVATVSTPYPLNQESGTTGVYITKGDSIGDDANSNVTSSTANSSAITSNSTNTNSSKGSNSFHINPEVLKYTSIERTIVNLILSYAKKLNMLKVYRYRISKDVVSEEFYEFISSEVDYVPILINRCTSHTLGSHTPLHYAASKGKPEVLDILIKNGALVNSLNYEGASALHLSCLNGHLEVVKALVSQKVSLNIPLKTGETPLHLAIYGLHVEVIEYLIDFYKDYNIQNSKAPSIWHALVCGIFRDHSQSKFKPGKTSKLSQPFEKIIEKLSLAVEISKIFIKRMETENWLGCYIWSNHLPSQLLQELWNYTFESNSLFYFPKNAPTVYVVSNPNGIMESPLKTPTSPNFSDKIGLYGSLKEAKYNVNNYGQLNQKNDVVFSATRTFHFLIEIMKKVEEQSNI